jgi:hypothetical protein
MIINRFKIFFTIFIFSLLLNNSVLAADTPKVGKELVKERLTIIGGKADFREGVDIRVFLGDIVKYFLGFLGVVFLGLLIYGGFTWMRARGDDQAVSTAKDTMINSAIGLIIVLGAYMITFFVLQALTSSTLT